VTVTLRCCLVVFALHVTALPASAQWTQVLDVSGTDMFSMFANGDTIAAGGDSLVHLSTDAGATWKTTVKVAAGVTSVQGVWVRNGRLYAGTFGQGVFVSDDLGDTWTAFNQGLVGGFLDTQLFTSDMLVRGDSLYLATSGAGVWVRNLSVGNWSHFGEVFEPSQASNQNAIAAGGDRLLSCAGFNGTVFFRDPGDPDWTLSWLNNVGLAPGLAALSAAWTGSGWVVGTNIGVFHSPLGEEPWTLADVGIGTVFNAPFVTRGRDLFAVFSDGFNSVVEFSSDDGATWHELETLPATFTYDLTRSGSDLYAGRADGLWRRSIANVSVPGAGAPIGLRFSLVGPQPAGDQVRFRFDLPQPGATVFEVFDLFGRRTSSPSRATWSAGSHEMAWDARGLAPGVYHARLEAQGRREVVRIVRAR
jgi:hypothetical protein